MAATNILYVAREYGTWESTKLDSVATLVTKLHANASIAFCVIENISGTDRTLLLQNSIGTEAFFDRHECNVSGNLFWHNIGSPDLDLIRDGVHIDGIFEYHGLDTHDSTALTSAPNYIARDCYKEERYGVQSNTRISYCEFGGNCTYAASIFDKPKLSWQ